MPKYLQTLSFFTCFCILSNVYGQDNLIFHKDSAFDRYHFNKECVSFIQKVQAYFIKINVYENLLAAEDGEAKITNDSVQILININSPNKEELIIHELFHIYLKVLGFPTLSYSFPAKNMETQSNVEYLNWINHIIWDKIEHYYFYTRMKNQLKLNPYTFLQLQLKNDVFKKNKINGLTQANMETALAAYYLQVWIETNDKTLLIKFRQLLIKKYNGLGIALGEELVSLFKKHPIVRSEDAIRLFIDCFNRLHKQSHIMIESPIMKEDKYKGFTREYATFPIRTIH